MLKDPKKNLRDQLEKDIAKFLEEGGQISQIPEGQGVLNHLQKESFGLYQKGQKNDEAAKDKVVEE